jgi:hypothetical protein
LSLVVKKKSAWGKSCVGLADMGNPILGWPPQGRLWPADPLLRRLQTKPAKTWPEKSGQRPSLLGMEVLYDLDMTPYMGIYREGNAFAKKLP